MRLFINCRFPLTILSTVLLSSMLILSGCSEDDDLDIDEQQSTEIKPASPASQSADANKIEDLVLELESLKQRNAGLVAEKNTLEKQLVKTKEVAISTESNIAIQQHVELAAQVEKLRLTDKQNKSQIATLISTIELHKRHSANLKRLIDQEGHMINQQRVQLQQLRQENSAIKNQLQRPQIPVLQLTDLNRQVEELSNTNKALQAQLDSEQQISNKKLLDVQTKLTLSQQKLIEMSELNRSLAAEKDAVTISLSEIKAQNTTQSLQQQNEFDANLTQYKQQVTELEQSLKTLSEQLAEQKAVQIDPNELEQIKLKNSELIAQLNGIEAVIGFSQGQTNDITVAEKFERYLLDNNNRFSVLENQVEDKDVKISTLTSELNAALEKLDAFNTQKANIEQDLAKQMEVAQTNKDTIDQQNATIKDLTTQLQSKIDNQTKITPLASSGGLTDSNIAEIEEKLQTANAEIAVLKETLAKMTTQNNRLNESNKTLNKDIGAVVAELNSRRARLDNMSKQNVELQQALSNANKKVADGQTALNQIQLCEDKYNTLTKQLEALKQENGSLNMQLSDVNKDHNLLVTSHNSLLGEFKKTKEAQKIADGQLQQINTLKSENQSFKQTTSTLQSKLDALNKDIERLDNQDQQNQQIISDLKTENSRLENLLKQANSKYANIENSYTQKLKGAQTRAEELTKRITELQAENVAVADKVAAAEEEVKKFDVKELQYKNEIGNLTTSYNKTVTALNQTQSEFAASKKQTQSLLAKEKQHTAELESQIASLNQAKETVDKQVNTLEQRFEKLATKQKNDAETIQNLKEESGSLVKQLTESKEILAAAEKKALTASNTNGVLKTKVSVLVQEREDLEQICSEQNSAFNQLQIEFANLLDLYNKSEQSSNSDMTNSENDANSNTSDIEQ